MLFLVPPHCEASMQLLAPAQLASHAKKINFPFSVIDINADIRGHFLTDDSPSSCNLRKQFNDLSTDLTPAKYWRIINELRDSLDERVSFAPEYAMSWDGLENDCPWDDVGYQIEFLESRSKSAAWSEMCKRFWASIKHIEFTVVGLNVTFASQFLEALAFAKEIRSKLPGVNIIFGGGLINTWVTGSEVIKGPFADLADIICVGEGEILLSFLAKSSLEELKSFTQYSSGNALYLNTSWILDKVDIPNVSPPIFCVNNFSSYTSPKLILPYRVSSVCYWGKCTFCADHQYKSQLKEVLSIAEHVTNIENLIEEYSAFGICFLDSAIAPKILQGLASGFIDRGLKFYWGTNARFDASFLEDGVLELLFKSGCRFLRFGLESASQTMLNSMDKGIKIETAGNILSRCRDLSVLTHAYVMTDFPGESESDRIATRQFLLHPKTHPDLFSVSRFIAYPKSIIANPLEGRASTDCISSNDVECKNTSEIELYIKKLHRDFENYYGPSRVLISPAHTIGMYDVTASWERL